MSEELKPCPFCGDPPGENSHELTQGFKYGAIACGCSAVGPDVRTGYEDWPAWKDAAVKAWNERAELSRLKAGQGEAVACSHGIRLPHECRDCADSQVVPYGWVEPVGGVFVDNFTKMCMRDRDASAYSLPLYTSTPSDPGTVPVRPELLDSCQYELADWMRDHGDDIKSRKIVDELRALLAQHEGVKP